MKLGIVLLLFSLLLPFQARAQDRSRSVEDILKGTPAYFDGLLLTEEKYKGYLLDQEDKEACQQMLLIRDTALSRLQVELEKTWWEEVDFYVGLGLGVVGTGVLAWTGYQVTQVLERN